MEGREEIRWRTVSVYVDIDTGEVLTLENVKDIYLIINKKKKSYVYKQTGTITYTNECRRSQQGKLF